MKHRERFASRNVGLVLCGCNIEQVRHQRTFTTLSVERVQIEVVVHTRGVEHIEDILAASAKGYRAERVG